MKNIQQLARFFALLLAVAVANDHAGAMIVELKWGESARETAGYSSIGTGLHPRISVGGSPLTDLLGLMAPEGQKIAGPIPVVSSGDRYQRPADTNAVATPDAPYLRPKGINLAPILTEKFSRHAVRSADMDWFIPVDGTHAETEDWLFLLQYADLKLEPAPGNAPLIPVPEPNTASLVICGLAGLGLRKCFLLGR